jgi:HD-GYP domain-containing protein (c-di-GMP phosphodiesterase class II)
MQEGEEGLVMALTRMMEAGNPALAGHQARVARLAEAMALAMGLPEEEATEIRLAASVHDIGLTYLPTQVISDLDSLKEVGGDLERLHPRLGHDVLAPVKFSFPLAQVVKQHHERLDGSGFPEGLRNQQILLKARIVAVADVADRVGTDQGREAATRELKQGLGLLYDPAAVEAALTLMAGPDFGPGAK